MSYFKHNAIIVVGHDMIKNFDKSHKKAKKLFRGHVTPIMDSVANGWQSYMVLPDGSKEHWETSNEWDWKRSKFMDWMRKNAPGIDAVDIRFGGDDSDAMIENLVSYEDFPEDEFF